MIKFRNKLALILIISVRGYSTNEKTLKDFVLKRCFERKNELNLYKLQGFDDGQISCTITGISMFSLLIRPPTKTESQNRGKISYDFLPIHYWKYAQMFTFTSFFKYHFFF